MQTARFRAGSASTDEPVMWCRMYMNFESFARPSILAWMKVSMLPCAEEVAM